MGTTEARKRANNKWDKDNMATLGCKMRKADADAFKEFATSKGKNANTLLRDYVLACLAGEGLPQIAETATGERTVPVRTRKTFTIVAGVEGSGKSSFLASQSWRSDFGTILDTQKTPNLVRLPRREAQEKAYSMAHQCIVDGVDFCRETDLENDDSKRLAKLARGRGYHVRLFYVALDSFDASMERISERARHGGYDMAPGDVRRQFASRFDTLKELLWFCDEVSLFDNSQGFSLVGEYRNGEIIPFGDKRPLWLLELIRSMQDN